MTKKVSHSEKTAVFNFVSILFPSIKLIRMFLFSSSSSSSSWFNQFIRLMMAQIEKSAELKSSNWELIAAGHEKKKERKKRAC